MTPGERTPKHNRFVDLSAGMSVARATSSPRRRRTSRKCLFGVPDREETRRLVSEQYARDRRRLMLRFDFDIERERSPQRLVSEMDKENTPVKSSRSNPGSPSCRLARTPTSGKSPVARRCLPRTPSNRSPLAPRQLHLTEYWSLRKRTESTSSDKD